VRNSDNGVALKHKVDAQDYLTRMTTDSLRFNIVEYQLKVQDGAGYADYPTSEITLEADYGDLIINTDSPKQETVFI